MMISLKQRDFYLLPALPVLAIALALVAAQPAGVLLSRFRQRVKRFRVFRSLSLFLLMASTALVIAHAGEIGRDHELLSDVHRITEEVPRGSIIGIPREMYDEWDLHAYMHRYGMISLDPGGGDSVTYCMTAREERVVPDPSCREIDPDLQRYRLFTCPAGKAPSR